MALVISCSIAAFAVLSDSSFDLPMAELPVAIQLVVPTILVTLAYAPFIACGLIAALIHRSVVVRTLVCLVVAAFGCLGGILAGELDSTDAAFDAFIMLAFGSLVAVVIGFFLYQFRSWRIRIQADQRASPKSSLLNWLELTAILGISFAFFGNQIEASEGLLISTGFIYAMILIIVTPMILIASTLVACYLGNPKRRRRARMMAAAFFLLTAYAVAAALVIADSGLDFGNLLLITVPTLACVITGTLSVTGTIAVLRRCGWRLETRRDLMAAD